MTKVLVLGAHPDDAEFFAGGLLAALKYSGATLRLISVTNGQSGHQSVPSSELILRRRAEAAAAGNVLESPYVTWDFVDGSLQPTLELRHAIIREIRSFAPDLVLTHRPFDYHPDHRAVGQAVQDASYMVRVPKVVPEIAPPKSEPIVAYMADLFTRPAPFRADVVLDASPFASSIVAMMHCHRSQFYEWMPWIGGYADSVPVSKSGEDITQREIEWLGQWYEELTRPRVERFWKPSYGNAPRLVEAYEISEYAGKPSDETFARLFPGGIVNR